jgi:hypothetical protein
MSKNVIPLNCNDDSSSNKVLTIEEIKRRARIEAERFRRRPNPLPEPKDLVSGDMDKIHEGDDDEC